jgi:hypothetical protein
MAANRSDGSLLSIGSRGSILSIGSTGSILSIGSWGRSRRSARRVGVLDPVVAVVRQHHVAVLGDLGDVLAGRAPHPEGQARKLRR